MNAAKPTALITGANRGIGRELALKLVAEGWRVVAGVRKGGSAPPGTHEQIVDMADPGSIDALAQRLHLRSEQFDTLVNNAGVYRGDARDIWKVNVLGPLLLTRALVPLLARGARIVMVTSGLGELSAQPAALVKRLTDPKLSLAELQRMASEAPAGYGGSKAALP